MELNTIAIIQQVQIDKLKRKVSDIYHRSLDQHVTLAVTGLSKSGKTAFITSLVNQLLTENAESSLHFFNVVEQGRYVAAKRVPQKHLHIARFDYEGAMSSLSQSPPTWPKSTSGISEIRLAIRYQPQESLLKYATDMATLYVDITDYPGEWLLDLPMLEQSYQQWSEQTTTLLTQAPRHEQAKSFLEKLNALDPFAAADENILASLADDYTQLLHYYRHQLGLSVIQPGRFILPGELANAPILQFFPFSCFDNIDEKAYLNAKDTSNIGMLRARYNEYKERVIKQFYQQHFVNFDRQIVLADCLTPLNNGAASFTDLQNALAMTMQSFQYGQAGVLTRLFSPKIDRLLFAATKADHVTPDQHNALVSLLNKLVYQTKQSLNFDAVKMKTIALASIQATKVGKSQYQGKQIPVIQGYEINSEQLTTLFPGSVPAQIPTRQYWQEQAFNFIHFLPYQSITAEQSLAHLRMDQALQFLLGDKLK